MQSPPLGLTKTEGLRSGIKDLISQTLWAWKHKAIQKSWRVALLHRFSEACNWVDKKILSAERLGETSRELSSWTQAPAAITDSSTAARGVQPPVPSYSLQAAKELLCTGFGPSDWKWFLAKQGLRAPPRAWRGSAAPHPRSWQIALWDRAHRAPKTFLQQLLTKPWVLTELTSNIMALHNTCI